MNAARTAFLALFASSTVQADPKWHGSAGAGTTLLITGDHGDRNRFEAEADLERGKFGGLIAWRGLDGDHDGLVTTGLMYEGGAARPRLAVHLHADIGFDLDQHAPVVGGGVRTTLGIYGPLGLALDTGGYLVVDGVDDTRFAIATGIAGVLRW